MAEALEPQVANTRIHGTTRERPTNRFASERLTPLSTRPPYRNERVQERPVANDALVTIRIRHRSVPTFFSDALNCPPKEHGSGLRRMR